MHWTDRSSIKWPVGIMHLEMIPNGIFGESPAMPAGIVAPTIWERKMPGNLCEVG